MGILDFITGKHFDEQTEEEQAEQWLESCTTDDHHISALVRHYAITEVTDHIENATGIHLDDSQTVRIVQKQRDKYGCGAIADYNMPGHIDPDDYPEDQAAQQRYYDRRNAVRARGLSYPDYAYGQEVADDDAGTDEEEPRGGGFFGWLFGK